ncbi:OmpH family outer membrane protein [Aureitalea sp. L0-47]|uniref:OmpH family outer membrane protein n=1 Tax=Aureitalea sp. L0-47 TaxID=2816962 RepID=UPI0022383A3B|nr:OmpH family outer membrane protein [Aureitalea sp. L0-47]MCW5521129.1 OmpH family outer membrane protein [Aureitalea sp. L0-47]
MKNSLRYILLVAVLVSSFQLQAQKYGHTNFANVLSIMPETKASDAQLESFQNTLADKIKAKQDSLRAKFNYYQSERNTLTIQQQQNLEKELNDGDQELQKFVAEADQQVAAKRQELLEPVITKAQKAVEDVAKENGYQLIFDTSVFNSVLMADESIDITEQVLKKLGVN